MKTIFEYGVDQRHLDKNPLRKWKTGKETRRKSQLTLEDLRKIQAEANRKGSRCKHLAWAIEVAWRIPVRPGDDLYGLRFEHIDWNKCGIQVYHTKVRRSAFIQLPDDFLWELRARQKQSKSGYIIEYQGKPIKRLDKALSNTAERLGLNYDVIMYDVRHLWITTAIDQGFDPSVIAHMAGTSIEMIHANYYEPHAVEQSRMMQGMPDLNKEENTGKVINIDKNK